MNDKDLIDPTGAFIESVRKEARIRGDAIASEHFEGDVVLGEVFADILSSGVICSLGNSLWDSPME